MGVGDGIPDGVYRPAAPAGGTDDYQCLLADPGMTTASFVTGVTFAPQNPAIVHHAILFRVDPAQVADARAKDLADPGPGWQCFGGTGIRSGERDPVKALDTAPWLAGWAPGGREQVFGAGMGVPMPAGAQIVVQIHYNLRAVTAGSAPTDNTQIRLRMSTKKNLLPMRTSLLPAPVELPCGATESGLLCNRGDALLDVQRRFGADSGRTVAGLQLLCAGDLFNPVAGSTQSCDRRVTERETIQAAAGHMHLLGKSIKIELNPGTKSALTLLNIPVWDFDNQGSRPLSAPVSVGPGDTIRVTCTHDVSLRKRLPELQGTAPRYIVWGEGTTDEMCLGILITTPGGTRA